jgi:hypothetical protein
MKKPFKEIRFERSGWMPFILRRDALRQLQYGSEWWWRQVSRSQIKDVFQAKIAVVHGKMWNGITMEWISGMRNGHLSIGCQTFSIEETEILRKWALARRRRKP